MKHPLRYRFLRLWYTRYRPLLRRRGGVSLCCIGGRVVVLARGSRLVSVVRAGE
jgi:hypothetical protein